MRTSNLTLALALLAFCATPVAAQESPTLKKIKDTGTITIGHRDSSIPFSYYDDKQQRRRLRDRLLPQGRRRGQDRAQDAQPARSSSTR